MATDSTDRRAEERELEAGEAEGARPERGITRRDFILGSAAASLLVSGTTMLIGCSSGSGDDQLNGEFEITELSVPESSVIQSSDFEELTTSKCISEWATYDIDMGSILHMDCDSLAIVISPGSSNNVLTRLGFLVMSSGKVVYFLNQAIGQSEGYTIYDARGNGEIAIWTECNLRTGDWRVYLAAVNSSAKIMDPIKVDEGDADFDPPMLCVCDKKAYWTVMPDPNGEAKESDSYLKCATVSMPLSQIVYTSHGRMITNPQASDGIVTIVPRADTSSTRYQMTAIDSATNQPIKGQILPKSMRVNTAIYMNDTFVFGIEQNYNFGDGISNFGTYSATGDGKYMRFNRTPFVTPAQVGKYIVIKSTKAVVGCDMANRQFFAIDTVKGSESYGDFLVSTGTSGSIVVYTSIPKGDGSGKGKVRVRAFSVL
ncbi:MAG: hypothetical protein IKE61_02610 [Coriobacteriales bacterium]|nr:hypothetical protein [Coriobacteriales bacterium]